MGYPMVDLNGVYDEGTHLAGQSITFSHDHICSTCNKKLNVHLLAGFGVVRYPIKNGVRQAPFKAFLEPIRSRTSLTIRKYAHVNKVHTLEILNKLTYHLSIIHSLMGIFCLKVLFREGNQAYGVEYDR